jgi:hypothetical protein
LLTFVPVFTSVDHLEKQFVYKSGKYLTYGQEATAHATKVMDDDGKKAVIGLAYLFAPKLILNLTHT